MGESSSLSGVQVTYVFDMKGWSMRNSPPMGKSIEMLKVFQLYYPERLGRMYVVDGMQYDVIGLSLHSSAPGWFSFFYKAVSTFIHPVTRAKIGTHTLACVSSVLR